MRITNIEERHFYEIESVKNDWSLSELKRQYDSSLYERLALTKNINEVMLLSQKGQIIEKPAYAIKDPYVLELPVYPEIEWGIWVQNRLSDQWWKYEKIIKNTKR